ncbi:MAG TPA: xanthine dehydrogenase family protein molybdopterin-binding subunit [Gammaproteobacteria bacterium]|nr:xanthine dehydrogenase family protein molybdopterin-binding subunit [Gammaproteobacteria bacterium]
MEHYGIGQPVRRKEDLRFLTGQGRYVDDITLDDLAHACMVRSTYAHARILEVDTSEAEKAPGVIAVLTGKDWKADGLGPIPTRTPAKNSDGSPVPVPERPALNEERVRYVGDGIAFVVADSIEAARDAAERVEVTYEPLPALVNAERAVADDAPAIWEDIPGNVCVKFEAGDAAAVDKAIANAAHVVKLSLDNQRVTAAPIEPRGAIGICDSDGKRMTLICASQNIHSIRKQLAENVFGVALDDLRSVAYDVGGGFGAKNSLYPEYALVLWAARRTGRPVKWINDRGESFLSDSHGRDQQSEVTLALDGEGNFLALKTRSIGGFGPYLLSTGPFTQTGGTARTQGGAYRIPAIHFSARAVFTHNAATDPYRGAGRPEASYQIERIVDLAAAELGLDPIEIRRRNLLTKHELPYQSGVGTELECGDFHTVMDQALKTADVKNFEARARQAKDRGMRLGLGLCCYLECSGGPPKEHASLRFHPDNRVTLAVGSQSTGTGHETTLPQIVAAGLGIDIDQVDYVQADTDATPVGGGHGGSRVLEMGGSATHGVTQRVIEKAKRVAVHLLEAAEADVEFGTGTFTVVGTDRSVGLWEVAEAARDPARLPQGVEPGLDAALDFDRQGITFPNGCHVAEAEVDPETGKVALTRYTVVDDFGTIINPLTAAGQVMGGTAQGIGQALLEKVIYDPDSGQLLTGSFMDYALPRADEMPPFEVAFFEGAPTAHNPLGVKGSGEAGCCGSLPAVVNAVVNALAPLGVRHIDMPLTPERVWRAIESAQPS